MDQNFQTSFIPKKPIVEERSVAARPVGFLFIIAIFILFVVLLGTGGLYFYQKYTESNLDTMKSSLNTAQKSFEPKKIDQLQLLDKRLRVASQILTSHTAVTPVFSMLNDITMHSVRFTKFSYDLGAGLNAETDIKMSGIAVGYRSVALQSDLLAQNKDIINPVFSNLTLDNSGNVLFDLEFSVSPTLILYNSSLPTQAKS